ncbi:MAG TPA: altronate hydrolase [Acholeplasmatales bacterium]|nr:MAG: altronate hydrolase [Tenericutes bacterium GWF2_57_13]HAQ57362.1 altronate hydrolase [Acholeplasmatales bacterium]
MPDYVVIHPADNVMVSLVQVTPGMVLNGLVIRESVPKGHKIALRDIAAGEAIIKYGASIGRAESPIAAGSHVHVHNVKTTLGGVESYEYHPAFAPRPAVPPSRTVRLYPRSTGEFGVRNELWIIPTVGCINTEAQKLAAAFAASHPETDNYDGIYVFGHPYGCSQMGDDLLNTRATLQNIALNPNAGGILVLGLGCENNQVSAFRDSFAYDPVRFRFLAMQDVKDERAAVAKLLGELHQNLLHDRRVETSIAKLRIGLKCGGSDGLSGITANPLIGRFADWLTAHGGTGVLTEVPEMFGAETILMARAASKDVFDKAVAMIDGFKEYYLSHGQVVYDNPSPGNKAGGITTLEDKSLGCTQKGGTGMVTDVLGRDERIRVAGLNLKTAPGNDLVSVTALGSAGCQIVLFSTGRGTPFGGFVPTVKLSTNTELYEKKPNWIDFDAGSLVTGAAWDETLEQLIGLVVAVADGKKTNNEKNDYREIAIFKDGVTL